MKQQVRNKLHGKAGFTLVELIVVIAILGILAGVGTVGYSGYIKKANQAADNQLLGAVNMAFSTACVEQNVNASAVPDGGASLPISATGTGNLTVSAAPAGADADAIIAAFDRYLGESKNTGWKYYVSLTFVDGVFLGTDSEGNTINYEELRAVLSNATYWDYLEGEDSLTGQVDAVVDALNSALLANPDLVVGTGFQKYLEELGLNTANPEDTQKISNAAVLYLAQKAEGMTPARIQNVTDKVTEYLSEVIAGGSNQQKLVDELASSEYAGSKLAAFAAIYATAEGIALKQGTDSAAYQAFKNTSLNNETDVLTSVGNMINATMSSGTANINILNDYAANQMQTDIDAYYKVLQAVNSQSDTLKLELDAANLYTDSETIQELIRMIKGS